MANDISLISQNPATIGKSATLVISAYDSSYVHRVTYTIGSIGHTMIVQGVPGGSYIWTIPTSFYDELPENAMSMEGTLACDTYSPLTGLMGTSYCQFKVHAGEELPTISASAFDTNDTTVALTGDSNKIIPGFSDIHCEMIATANNGSTISSVKIVGGSETVEDYTADFVGSQAYYYYFYATDARGLTNKATVIMDDITTNTVNYYRGLSCDMTDTVFETTGECSFNLSGTCWLRSFGAQTNTLTVQYRHREGDNAWGEWVTVTVSTNDIYNSVTHRYEYTYYNDTITLTGLDYKLPQYIQARAIDLLQTVETGYDSVSATPIFDWSNNDFNFNVPVRFSKGASGINCYGTCDTVSNTIAKIVDSEDVFELVKGMSIRVKFTYEHNNAVQPTLNVNGTGAKAVLKGNLKTWYNVWSAGDVKDFVYDGTNWVLVGGIATTTGYGAAILTSEYDDDDSSKAMTGIATKKAVGEVTSAFTQDVSNLKVRTTNLETKATNLETKVNTPASTSNAGMVKLATTISADDTTAATPGAVQDAIAAELPKTGSWTPVFSGGTTYYTQNGWYTITGNIITIGFYIDADVYSYHTQNNLIVSGSDGYIPGYKYANLTDFVSRAGGGGCCSQWRLGSNAVTFMGWEVVGAQSIYAYGASNSTGAGEYITVPQGTTRIVASGTISYLLPS